MNMKRSLRRSPAAMLFAVVVPLAGCGGGSDSPEPIQTAEAASLPSLGTATALDDNHAVGNPYWPNGATATGGQGQPIAGLTCGAVPEGYHVHTHLSILLNGQALAIPSNVGILAATQARAACDYPVHTHDLSGKIHLHATAPAAFSLGQFFAIWGQTLSPTDVAGITSLPVAVYLTDNGTVTRYEGDLAAIPLISHREITIQIGSAIGQVPNYTWGGP